LFLFPDHSSGSCYCSSSCCYYVNLRLHVYRSFPTARSYRYFNLSRNWYLWYIRKGFSSV
jgi:hypothetical protein